ncbi:hypothetical protein ACKAXJ_003652 [Escherichia coli]
MIYTTGTIAISGNAVTGTGTNFTAPLSLIREGCTLIAVSDPVQIFTITEIKNETELSVTPTADPAISAGTKFSILLSDSIPVDGLAQDVAETLRYYQSKETQIEEALEFFKNFDLKQFHDLVNQVKGDAEKTATDRAATEKLKNDAQQIKDSAVTETNNIKADTDAIKAQTQQIKDSAVAETEAIKQEAFSARDQAELARDTAGNHAVESNNAKAGAETARDEARQWAQQVNPENLLRKDQNLGDVPDKALARTSLELDRVEQKSNETKILSPNKKTYVSINDGDWGCYNIDSGIIPLSVVRGGTGGTTTFSACRSLRTLNYDHTSETYYGSQELDTGIGFYSADTSPWAGGDGGPYNYAEIMTIAEGGGGPYSSGNWSQIGFSTITHQAPRYRQRTSDPELITNWRDFLILNLNTTVDSNGFIKIASPIVKIKGDGTAEFNDESEGCSVTRVSKGVYVISGCLGLNSDASWGGINGGFEIPVDVNKQPLVWLDYAVLNDGSIEVRTYHRTHTNAPAFARNEIEGVAEGDPVDIPYGTFISVRVNMPE